MTQRDTLYINDTIIREHTRLKYVENTDTCVIVKHDSIIDTVYILIPIEFKEYKDTISNDSIKYNIDINYHGYKSDIDNILILTEWTKYLVVPEKHWKKFIGVGVGPGYSIGYDQFHRLIQAGPSVNVSLVFGWGYTWK